MQNKKCEKGVLYQSDVHGDNIVVLCIEEEKKGSVRVLVLRDETTKTSLGEVGDITNWSICRLTPFMGGLTLSN